MRTRKYEDCGSITWTGFTAVSSHAFGWRKTTGLELPLPLHTSGMDDGVGDGSQVRAGLGQESGRFRDCNEQGCELSRGHRSIKRGRGGTARCVFYLVVLRREPSCYCSAGGLHILGTFQTGDGCHRGRIGSLRYCDGNGYHGQRR